MVIVCHVLKFPAFIALIHVSLTGNPAAAWRYLTVCLMDGKSYALFAHSFDRSFFVLYCADVVHNFAPLDLLPWSTRGSVVVNVIVSFL